MASYLTRLGTKSAGGSRAVSRLCPSNDRSNVSRDLPHSSASQAQVLFTSMDTDSQGYLELDIIKDLLKRVSDPVLRAKVEELFHQHVFEEASFMIDRDAFISKWEKMNPLPVKRRGTQSPNQKPHKPTRVFLKLVDLKAPPQVENVENAGNDGKEELRVNAGLDRNVLKEIVKRRDLRLSSKGTEGMSKFIGKGKTGNAQNRAVASANVSMISKESDSLVDIHRRIRRLQENLS